MLHDHLTQHKHFNWQIEFALKFAFGFKSVAYIWLLFGLYVL